MVFREVPGELVQRRGYAQWFWNGLCLRRPAVNPPRDGVARVPAAPIALRLLPPRRLAVRLPAGMLALSYARVRPEPPAADRTWSLPGLWHGDASWSPRTGATVGFSSACLGQFWKVGAGQFSQAPKAVSDDGISRRCLVQFLDEFAVGGVNEHGAFA